ncbi:hypothetical protein L226DRAFT_536382 [Lentinus tigrinus ALCF2SS1-7]|uniref:uncharacterized protein n=1 Tax=Lentinus tigrinus ALCF2SS1-7 TaxID=1328758 RepID=UPI0011662D08|nr:hypothetical protein L226DRAFT_536382 [Lentinus tigrinus ALCF2SS1-7]
MWRLRGLPACGVFLGLFVIAHFLVKSQAPRLGLNLKCGELRRSEELKGAALSVQY